MYPPGPNRRLPARYGASPGRRRGGAGDEETRLEAALRGADDLLIASLRRDERAGRARRWPLILGGLFMIGIVGIVLAALAAALPTDPKAARPAGAPAAAAPAPAAGAPAPASRPAAAATTLGEAGQRVETKWGGKWFPSTVVRRDGERYFIKYDGWPDGANEWVTRDRIRPPGGAAAPADFGAARAGNPAGGPPAAVAAGDGGNSAVAPAEPDRSGARDVTAGAAAAAWSYRPAAAPATAPAGPAARAAGPVTLTGGTGGVFEKIESVLVAGPPARTAWVAHVDATPGQPERVRMERIDLVAGRSDGVIELPAGTRPFAVGADGSRLLLRSTGTQAGSHDRLDVCTIDPKGTALKPVVSFKPHGDLDWASREVEWAAFVDADHVLSLNRGTASGHVLTLWELPRARAVYTLTVDFTGQVALSPDGRYLLADVGGRPCLFEALTGRPAGALPATPRAAAAGAFRPDGRQLATFTAGRVQVWALEGAAPAAPAADVFLPPGASAGDPRVAEASPLAWVSDGFLLLGGRYLLDPKAGIIVWDYPPADRSGAAPVVADGRVFYVAGGRGARGGKAVLAWAALPDEPAKKAVAAVEHDQTMAIRPGIQVSLEVSLGVMQDKAQAVTDALTARLKTNGITVAPGQTVKLVASVTPGETKTVQYRLFGRRENVAATVTEQKMRLAFVVDDKTAWEADSVSGAPFGISLKQGQSIDDYIAAQRAEHYRFFLNTELPRYMPAPGAAIGLGHSTLAGAGAGPPADGARPPPASRRPRPR